LCGFLVQNGPYSGSTPPPLLPQLALSGGFGEGGES